MQDEGFGAFESFRLPDFMMGCTVNMLRLIFNRTAILENNQSSLPAKTIAWFDFLKPTAMAVFSLASLNASFSSHVL